MCNRIHSLYKKISNGIKSFLSSIVNPVLVLCSGLYIRRISKQKKSASKIKVAFIVQMPELWNKIEPVYHSMNKDKRFDTNLIIVPGFDFSKDRIGKYGKELQFFKNVAGDNKFIVAYENLNWKDISKLGFEYIFYQRPYDRYLPRIYRSSNLVKYAKICYVPYATPDLRKTVMYPSYFFRNIYFGFMDNQGSTDECNKKYHRDHICFYNIGYPLFESCKQSWEDKKNSVVLWTPRWSYDPIIGGSHFFEYKEYLTNRNWEKSKLIIRVHPLLWENFEKVGLLSSEEIEDLKESWERKLIVIDKNESIMTTFDKTDILISDRSSVIPLFFMTGKPIIYCPIETDYSTLYLTILPALYIANDENELNQLLEMLLNGVDPLKKKRKEIIESYFSNNHNATQNIVNMIVTDASNQSC